MTRIIVSDFPAGFYPIPDRPFSMPISISLMTDLSETLIFKNLY